MQISYKNNKLEKSLSSPREILKNYGTRAKNVNQRMEDLKAVANLYDLSLFPQANLHELKGDKKGSLAIDISANYRIIFKPDHETVPKKADGGLDWRAVTRIKIIEIEDYH
jgi:plasmid maintenance system killer protein